MKELSKITNFIKTQTIQWFSYVMRRPELPNLEEVVEYRATRKRLRECLK